MRRDFCTYFDHRYLTKGLALFRSLERHAGEFRLFILCLTPETKSALERLGLDRAVLVPLEELERFDPELAATKSNRSTVEYYFTCTPAWMRFLLARESDVELLTYLDADLFFFSSPEPLFEELEGASIGIVPHRFSAALGGREVYGRYNVGWVTFARGGDAPACLERWRTQCLEWCHDRVEPGRFADQKYLDDWPERFPGVVVLRHSGADLAPWNLGRHALSRFADDSLLVDGLPLVFFHAHGAEIGPRGALEPHLDDYGLAPGDEFVEWILAGIERAYLAATAEWRPSAERTGAFASKRVVPLGRRDSRRAGPLREGRAWPRISLVTPSLNQSAFLEATLRSVLDQNYPNLEYIVVDGGSTDGSVEIIERYGDRLAHWSSGPDDGQVDALNRGFARATGSIMGWINADDLLLPGSLFLAGEIFSEFPEIEWLTSRATALDPLGRIVDSFPQRPWTRGRFLASPEEFLQQESTLWARSLWDRAGGRLASDRLAFDFELWSRFFRLAPLHQTRGAIGAFRQHPDQRSRAYWKDYLLDVREILEAEMSSLPPERRGDESAEALFEIAFDPGTWRFGRVEATRLSGTTGRDLALQVERLEAALDLSGRDRAERLEVIHRLENSVAAYASALAGRIEENRVLDEALAGRIEENRVLDEALTGRIEQIAELHRSLSWRITGPLRRIADLLARRG